MRLCLQGRLIDREKALDGERLARKRKSVLEVASRGVTFLICVIGDT